MGSQSKLAVKKTISLKDYKKLQEEQKLILRPLPWILGLGGESSKIHKWILKHGVLERTWFLYSWKPSQSYLTTFGETFSDNLPRISPFLNKALDQGWSVLTKNQYNLLVVLKRLLDILETIPWNSLASKKERAIFSLRTPEALFHLLTSAPGSPQSLLRVFSLVAGQDDNLLPLVGKAADATKKFLNNHQSPSFYRILEGLNLLWLRRMVGWPDLFQEPTTLLVSQDEYDSTPEVASRIATHLVKLEKSLMSILQEKQDLDLILKYLPSGKGNETSQEQLSTFIKTVINDHSPLLPLIQTFLKSYLEAYGLILSGKVPFQMVGPPEDVFDDVYFSQDVTVLLEIYDHLERIIFFAPQLNYHRYSALYRGEGKISEGETKVLSELKKLSSRVMNAGKKMAIIWKEETFTEFKDRIIPIKGPHQGKTLEKVIQEFCEISFHFGAWIGNEELARILDSNARMQKDLARTWKDFERMGAPDRVQELAHQWNLELGNA